MSFWKSGEFLSPPLAMKHRHHLEGCAIVIEQGSRMVGVFRKIPKRMTILEEPVNAFDFNGAYKQFLGERDPFDEEEKNIIRMMTCGGFGVMRHHRNSLNAVCSEIRLQDATFATIRTFVERHGNVPTIINTMGNNDYFHELSRRLLPQFTGEKN